MSGSPDDSWPAGAASPEFCTTQWTVVRLAGGTTTPEATTALEKLCRAYWFPLYAYVRRQGHTAEDAQDLTQEFLAALITRRDFAQVDRDKGKFRSFLLACLNHFLANDWRHRKALKRGGGQSFIPMDTQMAEQWLAAESASQPTPERLYDQRWAVTVMEQSLDGLRHEMANGGKELLFRELKDFLTESASDGGYNAIAARLGMSPSAVATAVHRMRKRYRELVRATLAQTVTTHLELEEEMRYLLEVLS